VEVISILIKEVLMMKKLLVALINIIVILMIAGCASAVRYDGPYEGQVIDADTGKPIEGVVVLGVWYKEYPGAGGAVSSYHDAMETVTDKNGNFKIQGLGLQIMSNVLPVNILIFKAGYEYVTGYWSGLKNRGWKGEYEENYDPVRKLTVKKRLYDPKMKVQWEGKKAIIPLRKLTREERKRQGTPDFYIGERYDKKENITHSCLPKNIKILPKEVNKELLEQGRKPYDLEGGRCEK
jgi:hypothetical protein